MLLERYRESDTNQLRKQKKGDFTFVAKIKRIKVDVAATLLLCFLLQEITCLLCKHKTKLHLDKPKVSKDSTPLPSAPPSTQETLDSSSSSSLRKPTKKRKKDKFAGLNPSAFNQASTSSSNSSNPSAVISNKLTPCTSSSNTSQNPAKSSSKSSKKLKKSDNKILPLSNSIKKAKNKKGNVQNPPKQVSKTQQKNTLLQLAQLLKSGASLSNKKPNPLENLLR